MTRPPPISTLFPYTTLFRSLGISATTAAIDVVKNTLIPKTNSDSFKGRPPPTTRVKTNVRPISPKNRSEEHTLNSSHQIISYAVFCLKKKKKNKNKKTK